MAKIIHLDQLEVLGFHETQRTFIMFILIALLVYVVVKGLIVSMVKRQYMTLLTYIIVSLIVLLGASFFDNDYEEKKLILVSLQALSLFGFSLVIYKLFERLKEFAKRKWFSQKKRYT